MINHDPIHILIPLEVMALATGLLVYGFLGFAAEKGSRSRMLILAIFLGHLFVSATPALTAFYSSNPLKGRFVVAGIVSFFTTLSFLLTGFSNRFRRIVSRIPSSCIVAAHSLRIVPGVVLLALFEMGLLPATFALGAGYGDIISGVLALPVAWMLAMRFEMAQKHALIWNSIGLFDLIFAIGVGGSTVAPNTIEVAARGGSIGFINWFLFLPTFPVPLWISTHIVLYWSILKGQYSEAEQKCS